MKVYLKRNQPKFMLACLFVLASLAFDQSAMAVTYKPGWTNQLFYQAVQGCAANIVDAQSQNYANAAMAKGGATTDQARSIAISVTPMFDRVGTQICFCEMNAVAKNYSVTSFEANPEATTNGSMESCEKKAMSKFMSQSRDAMNSMTLK